MSADRKRLAILVISVALLWWLAFLVGVDGGKAIGHAIFG